METAILPRPWHPASPGCLTLSQMLFFFFTSWDNTTPTPYPNKVSRVLSVFKVDSRKVNAGFKRETDKINVQVFIYTSFTIVTRVEMIVQIRPEGSPETRYYYYQVHQKQDTTDITVIKKTDDHT